MIQAVFLAIVLAFGFISSARATKQTQVNIIIAPDSCTETQVFDYSTWMCQAFPTDMPMKMVMVHGNIFAGKTTEQGPRGQNAYWSSGMIMGEAGTTISSRQYLNLELMTTAEKWTLPSQGYPQLLQVGENQKSGEAYIDHQHPHSSPIAGLTLSNTIALGHNKDYLKFFFAPRGQSTDGPVAFMHRPTGVVNPDAPLGHHVGQDSGHISSTVIGTALRLGSYQLEASAFSGAEPKPYEVDLPLGRPNSYAARLTKQFSPDTIAMVSAARVRHTHIHEDGEEMAFPINRYSASLYNTVHLPNDWKFYNALISGMVTNAEHAATLHSFAEEFALQSYTPSFWGRVEVLERMPRELAIMTDGDPNQKFWISAITLGYTHKLASWNRTNLNLGASITENIIPGAFREAYGNNPWSGKIFLQIDGMKMWEIM